MVVKELVAQIGLDVDGSGFAKAEELFHALTSGVGAASLGVVALVGAFFEFGRETKNAAIEASRAADRMGITTQAVQELQFAADESGVSMADLETAMFRMQNAGQQAKEGSLEAARAFKGLLTLSDLKNATPDEQLTKLAEGLSGIQDPGLRARRVMEIFGRSGRQLLPLLNKGAAGIDELRAKFRELGHVFTPEEIENAKEYNRRLNEFGTQIQGLKYAVGGVALRALLKFGDALKAVVTHFKEWSHARPDRIFNWIKIGLITTAGLFAIWVAANLSGIGLVAGAYTFLGWAAIKAGAKMALGWLEAIWPIAVLAGGIIVLIAVVSDLIALFNGDHSYLKDFWFQLTDTEPIYKLIKALDKLDNWFGTHPWIGKGLRWLSPAGGVDLANGNSFVGGAASPTASASQSPLAAAQSAPPSLLAAPTINQTINAAPGMDVTDLASLSAQYVGNTMQSLVSDTKAQLP